MNNQQLSAATFLLTDQDDYSADQERLNRAIMQFIKDHWHHDEHAVFVLTGDAGTGKSAAIARTFSHIQRLARQKSGFLAGSQNNLLVNHQEMLKIYQEVAGADTVLHKKDFAKPTPFINDHAKTGVRNDITFVDEAHLLLTQPDRFNRFDQHNQLTEIIRHSRVVVLVFDPHQVLKLKSYWDWPRLHAVIDHYPHQIFDLSHQFRIKGAQTVADWINAFTAGQILPIPATDHYDFHVYTDGTPLYQHVRMVNQRHGLARMLATADFPFTVFGNKTWYVHAGSLRLPWDKINMTSTPWAQLPKTINEVGSIYTIQGFDLNYAGIVLGPAIGYDPHTQKLQIHLDQYQDTEAFKNRSDIPDLAQAKTQIIRNSLNVLLKRGRLGVGIYATDPNLRQALIEAAQESGRP
ncbi:DUF2075 domain-containing protein [Schleiferilactobacillus perolens]|jgi:DUF2075 family protein|uniref:Schlafen group 3-like DNA/RNA helicase domain-containing protein n=1 Tax=Schleiferilactobacillus perolens DSM 12744 TaxID=1423792 RepID=A0A0R1N305_9LACO|nr:DUF2075 domain-containing protein [Schleiferilactobacillus perolens]KRL14105.1 hypothetical protein FD09_GL001265 [Schleiferilactobacillus perolens DSM 12744]MCI1890719.1 DUF2075 domain-containing protein [Schleiferilactobacillus harbinensis]MCI1913238.1 DUF2075 domain-containing protein [Schleiferilactobacillus harbinensis]MCI2172259.1 DUF2075 domain-containing protein [Schleiferilactobacillus perolens]